MVEGGEVPPHLVVCITEGGLFGVTLPHRYGGRDWSMGQQVRLTFEFTRTSAVYRSRFSTNIGLVSQVLLDHGSVMQKKEFLPRLAAGQTVGSFALTEESAGSDATAMKTAAIPTTSGYRLNGAKRYIINSAWADFFYRVR